MDSLAPFDSSDSQRAADALPFAKSATLEGPWPLRSGEDLARVDVAYETYGRLNEDRSNAVLICHALSGDSHVARHSPVDAPGWWDLLVGPGKPVDTRRYFVICTNVLGGCRGTTGPGSVNPETRRRYGRSFPTITIEDMVDVQRAFIESLGIRRLLAVIGGSMGGHQALAWAAEYPERVHGIVAIATSARLSSQALAFDIVARNAIVQDPHFADGQYYERENRPAKGLAIARMIGHITYLSRESMGRKFDADRHQPRDVPTVFEKRFSVGSYLGYQGKRFVERFDANTYNTLTTAMDLFDLGTTVEDIATTFRQGTNPWLVISFSSDWLFPAWDSKRLVDGLLATNNKPVSYCNVISDCGHDAFLLENELDVYGRLICGFLAGPERGECPWQQCREVSSPVRREHSVFHAGHGDHQRVDYERIAALIPAGASVLDLGCGSGEFLDVLRERGHAEVAGVEIDQECVTRCVCKGIPVVQEDLNRGLPSFGNRQFDVVVLSRTLQTVRRVETVIEAILRVGAAGIVSFPNFGYHRVQDNFADTGRAPRTRGLLHHKWYDTPNIRVLTIRDFQEFCHERGICIERMIALDTEQDGAEVNDNPNRNADLAIFRISR